MRARRWQFILSVLLTIGIIVLAYFKRDRIELAFSSLREARPSWLVLALALELFAFFLASQVYDRVLRSLGYRINALRLWAIALVGIILLCLLIAWLVFILAERIDRFLGQTGRSILTRLLGVILARRVRMQGFIILDHYATRFADFRRDMARWVDEGRIVLIEDIVDGLEQAPDAFIGLLQGRNFGKLVVRVSD